MCILPPNCLFCTHYHHEPTEDGWECDAFEEIPDAIFAGGNGHISPFKNDQGYRFELNPEYSEEFADVEELRRQIMRSG
jgi:hypothetical protein